MALTNSQKEKISIEVINTLVTRFENFPKDTSNNRNAPFHEAFLRAFADKLNESVSDTPYFITLSSWLHGLNTTLGQNFFENVAHILSDGEKREYTSKRLGNLLLTRSQRNHIAQIIADLSNSTTTPSLENENSLLFAKYEDDTLNAMDFSADVFIFDSSSITAIELKSVKPNSGEMKGEKQKILEGKAALYNQFPGKDIKFYIGFPFDPTVNPANEGVTSFNKERFLQSIINMNKYFDSDETLVASELWDKLSGQKNTMEDILEIINNISTTSFYEKFQLIRNPENRDNPNYLSQLMEWNLYSESALISNQENLNKIILKDRTLTRVYNKSSFNLQGGYNWDRYYTLYKVL